MHELKDLPDGFAQGIWAKLAQQSELAEMPSDVKAKYIKDMETEMDKRAQMKWALRKATEQGLAEGRAQGFEQGRAEGLEQGIEQGIDRDWHKVYLKLHANLKMLALMWT